MSNNSNKHGTANLMEVIHDNDAFLMLSTPKYNIRDKFLQELRFFHDNYIPCAVLSCSNHNGEQIIFEIEFRNLVGLDFYFVESSPGYIEDYKLELLSNGNYYLSLDPDDSKIEISADDCRVIIAKEISLIIKMD